MSSVISDIKKEAELHFLNEKITKQYLSAIDLVLMYFKKFKRVHYGGSTISRYMKQHKYDDPFIKNNPIPDYDVYSPEPKEDCRRIVKMLLEHFPSSDAQATEAMHPGTYKIFAWNSKEIADITYLPPTIVRHIPTTMIDGQICSAPELLIIDILIQICNPISGWNKLEKVAYRGEFLMNLLKGSTVKEIPIDTRNNSKIVDILIESLNSIIIVGSYAYNHYMSIFKKKKMNKISMLEAYCVSPYQKAAQAYIILRQNFPDAKISIKKYYPFMTSMEMHTEIVMNSEVICKFHKIPHSVSLPYTICESVKIGTLPLVLKNLYVDQLSCQTSAGSPKELLTLFLQYNKATDFFEYKNLFGDKTDAREYMIMKFIIDKENAKKWRYFGEDDVVSTDVYPNCTGELVK